MQMPVIWKVIASGHVTTYAAALVKLTLLAGL